MPWMSVTCGKCNHTASLDDWTRTPVSGDLPRGVFQCQKCRYAFERCHGKPTVYPSGFVMPGPVSLVPAEARL